MTIEQNVQLKFCYFLNLVNSLIQMFPNSITVIVYVNKPLHKNIWPLNITQNNLYILS